MGIILGFFLCVLCQPRLQRNLIQEVCEGFDLAINIKKVDQKRRVLMLENFLYRRSIACDNRATSRHGFKKTPTQNERNCQIQVDITTSKHLPILVILKRSQPMGTVRV